MGVKERIVGRDKLEEEGVMFITQGDA